MAGRHQIGIKYFVCREIVLAKEFNDTTPIITI